MLKLLCQIEIDEPRKRIKNPEEHQKVERGGECRLMASDPDIRFYMGHPDLL